MSSLTHSGLSLVPIRPSDDGAIRDWYELRRAATSADQPQDPPPCPQYELGRVRHPWPGQDETVWVARLDDLDPTAGGGRVVGGCLLQLPTLDNLRNAAGHVLVAPGYRRQGIGRALLAHLVTEATRHGRSRLIAEVDQPLDPEAPDPASRFAVAGGAVCALQMTRRRLDVATVDPAGLAGLDEQARAKSPGYSLVHWVGATPQRRLADMAYLTGRMSTDAPMDDLQWEAESYDSARMRERDAVCLARGCHIVTTGALDEGGRLVAFTRISGYPGARWYAEQWDTIVAPEHRGHRLGTLIKVANLGYVRQHRPELRVIDTWNADSNPYMVGINEAMGFRAHSRLGEWQLDL